MAAIDDILGGGYSQPTATKPPEHLQVSTPEQGKSAGTPQVQTQGTTAAGTPETPSQSAEQPQMNVTPYTMRGVSGAPVVIGRMPSRDMSYVELYEMMNPDKPETDEDKAKREQ